MNVCVCGWVWGGGMGVWVCGCVGVRVYVCVHIYICRVFRAWTRAPCTHCHLQRQEYDNIILDINYDTMCECDVMCFVCVYLVHTAI